MITQHQAPGRQEIKGGYDPFHLSSCTITVGNLSLRDFIMTVISLLLKKPEDCKKKRVVGRGRNLLVLLPSS